MAVAKTSSPISVYFFTFAVPKSIGRLRSNSVADKVKTSSPSQMNENEMSWIGWNGSL